MQVYLTKTHEVSDELISNVLAFFQTIPAPLNFSFSPKYILSSTPTDAQLQTGAHYPIDLHRAWLKSMACTPINEVCFDWEELFALCNWYRTQEGIENEAFVVIITQKSNYLNWFSHFDNNRNILIHAGDWEHFTKAALEFPISYQIVENLLQSLMKLDFSNNEMVSEIIHMQPKGCVNDFCRDKAEVSLKLRTGDFCFECLARLRAEKVEEALLEQALGIFETIRQHALFKLRQNALQPKPIYINQSTISIGQVTLNLNPLEKTLLLFFITVVKAQGIRLDDLNAHHEALWHIYQRIRPGAREETITELVKPYHLNGTFSVNKSRLNRKLKEQLGTELGTFYCISGNRGGGCFLFPSTTLWLFLNKLILATYAVTRM